MFTVILVAILTYTITYYRSDYSKRFNATLAATAGTTAVFLMLMVGSMIYPGQPEIEKSEFGLVSLGNQQSIEGKFFLGSGNINGTNQYKYFVKTNRGYKGYTARMNDSYIKTIENQHPYVEIKVKTYGNFSLFSFRVPVKRKIMTYTFYVPEGSIKHYYNPN